MACFSAFSSSFIFLMAFFLSFSSFFFPVLFVPSLYLETSSPSHLPELVAVHSADHFPWRVASQPTNILQFCSFHICNVFQHVPRIESESRASSVQHPQLQRKWNTPAWETLVYSVHLPLLLICIPWLLPLAHSTCVKLLCSVDRARKDPLHKLTSCSVCNPRRTETSVQCSYALWVFLICTVPDDVSIDTRQQELIEEQLKMYQLVPRVHAPLVDHTNAMWTLHCFHRH